jgi:UDP-GlcNAc:undecaprenyl-phosphate/decaprenyl-phosphate GlcNAc-1-phosphate transferase
MPVQGDLGYVLAAVACGVFVTVAEPVTIPLLRRLAAIDVPGARSSHTVPTPRGGGAPIALGLVIAALLIRSPGMLVFGAVVGVFAVIGMADDLGSLPASTRLIMQAGTGLAAGWIEAREIAGLPQIVAAAAAVLLSLWLTGYVNAFNFMDGVNGISGAHALVGGLAFACIGFWRPEPVLAAGGAAVAAGALAFLPWNAVRARVFLGDVGSYALGAALALLAAGAVLRGIPVEAALGPLALYLADTAWTIQRRMRAGERLMEAHRTHAYQRLCDVGWSHQRVTAVTAAVTVVLSLLGAVSLTGHPGLRAAADLTAIALLAAYLSAPARLRRGLAPAQPGLESGAA